MTFKRVLIFLASLTSHEPDSESRSLCPAGPRRPAAKIQRPTVHPSSGTCCWASGYPSDGSRDLHRPARDREIPSSCHNIGEFRIPSGSRLVQMPKKAPAVQALDFSMLDQSCHQPADEENVEKKTTRDCPKPRKESAVPKFYVESGPIHLILDAATAEEAAVKTFQWTCDKDDIQENSARYFVEVGQVCR